MASSATMLEGEGRFSSLVQSRGICVSRWRWESESNEAFADDQPQYPDLQGNINAVPKGAQAVSASIRALPDLTRQSPVTYSVIEETVEGFWAD